MYRFLNFKGFADATLDLRTPVTILIGRNGAGKSNAIEALRVLSAFLQRYKFVEINNERRTETPIVRGGLEAAVRQGQSSFALEYLEPNSADQVCYRLSFEHLPTAGLATPAKRHVVEELREARGPLFRTSRAKDSWFIEAAVLDHSGEAFPTAWAGMGLAEPDTASLPLLWGEGPEHTLPAVWAAANRVKAGAKDIALAGPDVRRMREAAAKGDTQLAEDMHNVAAILDALKNGPPASQQVFASIVELIRALPEEDVMELQLIEIKEINKVMFALRMAGGLISTEVLSHGTLMTLGLAAAAEACLPNSVLIIEDLDAGIHPARVQALYEHLWKVAERRQLRILVTTHNTALLDRLTLEQRKGVVVCHWDANEKASKLTPLDELRDYVRVVTSGSLGEAARDGVIDAAAQSMTPEQTAHEVARHLAWFTEFERDQEAAK